MNSKIFKLHFPHKKTKTPSSKQQKTFRWTISRPEKKAKRCSIIKFDGN